MTKKQEVKEWLYDPKTPRCAWMQKTYSEMDKENKCLEHSCKYIPKIIAEKSGIKEQWVRTIRNVFHYTFKLQKPILSALAKAGKEGLSAEKVWEKIGVNDKFLCKEKKKLFVELTRSLLCMMKGEKLVESCETPNGTVWKIPDEQSDHQTK